MAYKWKYPSEWLFDKMDGWAATGNVAELVSVINSLMSKLPEDDVQDLFQAEMDRDGYFEEIEEPRP